jgi:hypothetical protein
VDRAFKLRFLSTPEYGRHVEYPYGICNGKQRLAHVAFGARAPGLAPRIELLVQLIVGHRLLQLLVGAPELGAATPDSDVTETR